MPPSQDLQNVQLPQRHPPTLTMRLQVPASLDTPAWSRQPRGPRPGLSGSGPVLVGPAPLCGHTWPLRPPRGAEQGLAGGVSLVQLQGEGPGDFTAAPIPFLFHESCY